MIGPFDDSLNKAHDFGASLLTSKFVLEALDEDASACLARADLIEEFGIEGVPSELLKDTYETSKRANAFLNQAAKTYEQHLGISA
jgi:hypothetical protein